MIEYNRENFTTTISTKEFIHRFRYEEKIEGYCRECYNYGKSWGCPPFDFNVEERLLQYEQVIIIATKIVPFEKGLPISTSLELLFTERQRLDKQLLEMEHRLNGLACSFVGKCLYCPDDNCPRIYGISCRHPEKIRPSLEAYGFDVIQISHELFGIELLWSTNGLLPDYLTVVCALFHNRTDNTLTSFSYT